MILDRTVDVYRLNDDVDDSDREAYETVISGIKMNIQPVGPEFELAIGDGSFGKNFIGFAPLTASGINEGMIVAVSGTTTVSGFRYTVTGVDDWTEPRFIPHVELQLQKNVD